MGSLNYYVLLLDNFLYLRQKIRGKTPDKFVAVTIYHRKDATCDLTHSRGWQSGKRHGLAKVYKIELAVAHDHIRIAGKRFIQVAKTDIMN